MMMMLWLIPSLVVCVGPLHINVATLSNPLILDDPSQVFFAFTPSQLPLLSFSIHSIHASACSFNRLLVEFLDLRNLPLLGPLPLHFLGG
jgi:hypothetical protein